MQFVTSDRGWSVLSASTVVWLLALFALFASLHPSSVGATPPGTTQPADAGASAAPSDVPPAAPVAPQDLDASVPEPVDASAPPAVAPTPGPESIESAPVVADDAAATPASDVPTGSVEPGSDPNEIVVTANRRRMNLQDYAGSANAFSQQDLQRAGIVSVRDVAKATPSVEIGTSEGNTEIFIRGIGSNYDTELGDPAAAMHIDGVYIPRPRGVGSMLFDTERLEISRGPQGTLRGRNSTAGTINVITNKPELGEWAGDATLQLGNYSQRLARGMINIPIGDALALRLAAFSEVHSPFFDNGGPVHTLKPSESADTLAYRASLKWLPLDLLTVNVAHDYTREGGTGYSGSNFANPLAAGLLPEEIPNPRAVIYRGPQAGQDMIHWGARGDVVLDLGPLLVNYLGSYRDMTYSQITAGNAGVAFPGMNAPDIDNWGTSYWHTTSKSIVQELRVYAPDKANLRWTVGGFLFNEAQTAFLGTTADKSNGFAGVEYNMPDVDAHSYAGYADATYDLLQTLRVGAGARVTADSKSRDGVGYVYSFSGIDEPFRFGTEGFKFRERGRSDYRLDGTPPPPFEDFRAGIARFGARDTIDDALDQPGVSQDVNQLNEQHGKYDATFVDFRIGTDYDLTDDNLLYLTFSTGHQSGGFNDTAKVNGELISPRYDPESLYATEVGSKNSFLDGKLVANVAAFWYHYTNQQFAAIVELTDTGSTDAVAASSVRYNAARSRVLGAEAELNGRLPGGFRARLAATALDARVTRGKVADTRVGYGAGDQPVVDLAGNSLPRAPHLSLNYALGQTIKSSVGDFDWTVSAQTRTKQYMTAFNGEGVDSMGKINPNLSDVVPSYTRFDVNVGYTRPDGGLRLELFCNNVTDIVYMTTLINTPGLNIRFFNPPRQFGVSLTVAL
jgi:iron complex outermembrane receptor protein